MRLVAATNTGAIAPAIHEEIAEAHGVGLHGASLLKEHFAEFFRAHVAERPVTLGGSLGVITAFFRLVEQSGVPLRWPTDECGNELCDDMPLDPIEALGACDWVNEEYMDSAILAAIAQPRPRYYGLGVQSWMDMFHPMELANQVLTLALWTVFQKSPWAIGIELAPILKHASPDVVEALQELPSVDSSVGINALCLAIELPCIEVPDDVDVRDLLGYAFGETANPLANISDYEAEAVHFGEYDEWSWQELPRLRELRADAALLEETYLQWSKQFKEWPVDNIKALGRSVKRALRILKQADQPKTLVDILARVESTEHFEERIGAL